MSPVYPPLPEWITSQMRARVMCAHRCGRHAQAEITWAGNGRTELLCYPCTATEAAEQAARQQTRTVPRVCAPGAPVKPAPPQRKAGQ